MNAEVSGGLIQMTAKAVRTGDARTMITLGIILAAVGAILTLCAVFSRQKRHKWRWVAAFAALALAGAILVGSGAGLPRRKILYCCANGPVDLQLVAARYDLIEVDGKFIKLAER